MPFDCCISLKMDPNEIVGPVITGWPLDGPAAGWILDLVAGNFGELRLNMGHEEVVQLFGFSDDLRGGQRPRGPAAVRLRISFEEDEEIPEDDEAEMSFVTDVGLDWDELVEFGDDGSRAVIRPLVLLPSRKPIPCTSLSMAELLESFGDPTYSEVFDPDVDEWLIEWLRDGFFVTATTTHGILVSVSISSLGLRGVPPFRLINSPD